VGVLIIGECDRKTGANLLCFHDDLMVTRLMPELKSYFKENFYKQSSVATGCGRLCSHLRQFAGSLNLQVQI
jgi:hypothetical protein